MIDGGPSPQALGLALGQRLPFWDRTIELMVLTHPHADHFQGLIDVLDRYSVGQVLLPALVNDSPFYREFIERLSGKEIKSMPARSGQRIELGRGAVMDVLAPSQPGGARENEVDNSGTVLRLSLGRVSFLFTADIQSAAEWDLIGRRAGLRSTVLKVAHHGSVTSTTGELLSVVRPEIAVISVGAGNQYGHPAPATLWLLESYIGADRTYRTDRDGTVEVTTDGERLWVRTGRDTR